MFTLCRQNPAASTPFSVCLYMRGAGLRMPLSDHKGMWHVGVSEPAALLNVPVLRAWACEHTSEQRGRSFIDVKCWDYLGDGFLRMPSCNLKPNTPTTMH